MIWFLLLLQWLQFWEWYVLELVIFHLRKASYWNLSGLVLYKYKIPLVCIKRLSVNVCLDSSKKSTPEQRNTSQTWEGYFGCYGDHLPPPIYPDASIPLNSRANSWAWKHVLKVNTFWTSPVKVLQNQGILVLSILPGSPIICRLSKVWLGTGLIAAQCHLETF